MANRSRTRGDSLAWEMKVSFISDNKKQKSESTDKLKTYTSQSPKSK